MSAGAPFTRVFAPAALLTGAVALFGPAMEWLFFATKPSFLDAFSLGGRAAALVVPPLLAAALLVPLAAAGALLEARLPRYAGPLSPALLPATLALGATGLVLADNFTTTVFGLALARSSGLARFGWSLGLAALLVMSHRLLRASARRLGPGPHRRALASGLLAWAAVALLTVAVRLAIVDPAAADVPLREADRPQRRPNILLVSSDAVEARWMSLYGFAVPTTPFLERFAAECLVCENAFTNAGKTTGATLALLTGQAPWRTRAGYPPQVLGPADAFQHLPAMLRKLGYRARQRTVRYYADAADLNLLGAFEETNHRRRCPATAGTAAARAQVALNPELHLWTTMRERAVDRLLHAAWLRAMSDAFLTVSRHVGVGPREDRQTVAEALRFIRATSTPYFLQLHFMGTHPGDFRPARAHFAAADLPPPPEGLTGEAWVGLLNALADNDETLAELFTPLAAEGRLDDTLVVFTSDHSQAGGTNERLPLLVRFPGGAHAGRLASNAQHLDVAPTILDVLGLEAPAWMLGRSLLEAPTADPPPADLTAARPLLSFAAFGWRTHRGARPHVPDPGPPFFGVRAAGVVLGARAYTITLADGATSHAPIAGHTRPWPDERYPPDAAVRDWAAQALRDAGYRVGPVDVGEELR